MLPLHNMQIRHEARHLAVLMLIPAPHSTPPSLPRASTIHSDLFWQYRTHTILCRRCKSPHPFICHLRSPCSRSINTWTRCETLLVNRGLAFWSSASTSEPVLAAAAAA
jgi:hypothetical protein